MKTETLTEKKNWDFEIIPAEDEIHIFDKKVPTITITSIYAHPLGSEEIQAAKYICKAVNNHEALLSALKGAKDFLKYGSSDEAKELFLNDLEAVIKKAL